MEKIEGEIGSKIDYSAEVVDGKAEFKVTADFIGYVEKAGSFIKVKIPGGFDDAVIDGFISLLKAAFEKEEAPKPE